MTEYMRLCGLVRWRQEQTEVLALLNRWSWATWEIEATADGVGQIARATAYLYPRVSRREAL